MLPVFSIIEQKNNLHKELRIMRNRFFYTTIFIVTIFLSIKGLGQDNYNILPTDTAGTIYYNYLYENFLQLAELRNAAVTEALTDSAKQIERRDTLRTFFKELIGETPELTDLNAEIVDTIDRSDIGFIIEKLTFQSCPNHHVTASFYIPTTGTGPYPGVLELPGHYGNAKAADVLQRLCMLLAENGFATLILDPMGQSERGQVINPATGQLAYPYNSGTTSQSLMDYGSILVGRSATAWELWDNRRALDYLYSRTDVVDTSKIGVTGGSGGGAQTLNLISYEYDRIDAAEITSWSNVKTRTFAECCSQAGPHHLYYQGVYTIDQPDQMMMLAPKPLMILAGSQDFIDTAGTHEVAEEISLIYDTLHVKDKAGYFESNDGHDYTQPKREAAVRWFRTWFYNDTTQVTDSLHSILSETDLRVTSTGQVTTAFENEKTTVDLNVEIAKGDSIARHNFWTDNTKDSCLNMVKELIKFNDNYESPTAETLSTIDRETYTIDKVKITSNGEIPIPVLLFKPKNITGKCETVIFLDASGKSRYADAGAYIERNFIDSGKIVMTVDLRGTGETRDTKSDSKYGSDDHRLGIVSMYNGTTMMGQRVEEVLKCLDIVAQDSAVNTNSISIVGMGRVAPVALHAAAFDERIKDVRLYDTYNSWMDIVSNAAILNIMSYVVPRALKYYDFPDLVNAIAPRPVEYCKSFESRLSLIRATGGTLSPAFSSTVYDYQVVVSDTVVGLQGYLMDGRATYIGDSSYNVKNGPQTAQFIVTAENGVTQSMYTVEIPQYVDMENQLVNTFHFSLDQNYPNPFSGNTSISYEIDKPGLVSLKVFDITGKEVALLVDKFQVDRKYSVQLDGKQIKPGIYFYQLKCGEKTISKKMIKLR